MTPTERGWLAGIIDGEGTVSLDKRGAWRYPFISAGSTDLEILTELKRLIGGCISDKKESRNKAYRRSWTWKLGGAVQVLAILKWMSPLLRCPQKRARAEYVLEHYPKYTRRNGSYTEAEKKEKKRFEEKFFTI